MKTLVTFAVFALLVPFTMSACSSDGGSGDDTSRFLVRIENISDQSTLASPLAPGLWAVHHESDVLFGTGMIDRGEGLEALAEDGDPSTLLQSIEAKMEVAGAGVFNTPLEQSAAGPAFPGQAYQFEVSARAGDGKLSLATMFVQSNDVFLATGTEGIDLFDQEGMVLPARDVTESLWLFDAGTEYSEAPGQGVNQAPRQSMANHGPSEGVVREFVHSTRALPLASGLVSVSVSESAGEYTFTLNNISLSQGVFTTPIAPVFWALHDGSYSIATIGGSASAQLESLAEDGSPALLAEAAMGNSAVGLSGVVAESDQHPGMAGPIVSGESYTFSVQADGQHPYLTFAAMVVQSNDVFLSPMGMGIRLVEQSGDLRSATDVASDIQRTLLVMDAGTEANEVPGVGMYQAPRQAAANSGPQDSNALVRTYSDATNDLSGEHAGGFVGLTIVNTQLAGEFEITFENRSQDTAYPGMLTPVVWSLHDGSESLFQLGQPAAVELERLAEDGDGSALLGVLSARDSVEAGVLDMPVDGQGAGPLLGGQSYQATIMVDAQRPYLNLISMVVPSNDTFVALGEMGIKLLDDMGQAKSDVQLAQDIADLLRAYDAGTEANQAGASGPDQAPHQAMADSGVPEGDSTVRTVDAGLWPYPDVRHQVRVTVTPIQ